MFETLKPTPPDKIIELMGLYKADPRTDKIDLGVGVYKDAAGPHPGDARGQGGRGAAARGAGDARPTSASSATSSSSTRWPTSPSATPVPARAARRRPDPGRHRRRSASSASSIRRANPAATVWHSDPTWPNHPAILAYLGDPGAHLPLLRRRHPRRRLRRDDGRPDRAQGRRRAAAARLLPQPDRRQPRPRPVARGDRLRAGKRRGAVDRPRLPGLRRRARRRTSRACATWRRRCPR